MGEKFKKKLLVEGSDDQHVVWALCKRFNIMENFDVIDSKGVDKLLEQIPTRLKESDISTLGVIVDADTDLSGRWNELRRIFSVKGFQLPEELPYNGLVVSETDKPSIGIWIMPNNNLNGILEDFLAFLVHTDDCLLSNIKDHLCNLEKKELSKYKLKDTSKALIHSWLAVQEDPGTPLGLSITKRYLTTDETTCSVFIDWMKELFKE